MNNSNELFKVYVLQQEVMVRRGLITAPEGVKGISGYYSALKDMQGVDELTEVYRELGNYALTGTTYQASKAVGILKGDLSLTSALNELLA